MTTEIGGHNVKVRLQSASYCVPTAAMIAAAVDEDQRQAPHHFPSRHNATAGPGICRNGLSDRPMRVVRQVKKNCSPRECTQPAFDLLVLMDSGSRDQT